MENIMKCKHCGEKIIRTKYEWIHINGSTNKFYYCCVGNGRFDNNLQAEPKVIKEKTEYIDNNFMGKLRAL